MKNQNEIIQNIIDLIVYDIDIDIDMDWSAIVIRCEIDENQSRESMQYFTSLDKNGKYNISISTMVSNKLRNLKNNLIGMDEITAFQLIISKNGKYEIKNYFDEIDWDNIFMGIEIDYELLNSMK